MKRYMILGAGFQGRACAFDMLRNPDVGEVVLCDASAENLASAKKFLAKVVKGRAKFRNLDAGNPRAVGVHRPVAAAPSGRPQDLTPRTPEDRPAAV